MRPTDCGEGERDAIANEAETEMVLPHIAGGLDVDEHKSGRESKSAEPSRAQHQEEGGEGKVGREGGWETKRKQRTIIGLDVERQHVGAEPLDRRALLPQLRKKCPKPLDMTEVEMADLVAQWVAQEDSNPGSKELERIWHGSASHASNSYSSHYKIDEHCSFQDDVQTMVGTLMVRAHVTDKESKDFRRVAERFRSEAEHYKEQARFFRKELENSQSKHVQMHSETAALFDLNRDLFVQAERASWQLSQRVTAQHRFFLKLEVLSTGGRAWRAWSNLCVFRKRSTMTILIAYRRKALLYRHAALRRWGRAVRAVHKARIWLRAWHRAVIQQRACRERRECVVLHVVLNRKANQIRIGALNSWMHTTMRNRKRRKLYKKIVGNNRRYTLRNLIYKWGLIACTAAKLTLGLNHFHCKARSKMLSTTVQRWSTIAVETQKIQRLLSNIFRRASSRACLIAWRSQFSGEKWRLETLKRTFRIWHVCAEQQRVQRQLFEWFQYRHLGVLERKVLQGWCTFLKKKTAHDLVLHEIQKKRNDRLFRASLLGFRNHVVYMCRKKHRSKIVVRRILAGRCKCFADVFRLWQSQVWQKRDSRRAQHRVRQFSKFWKCKRILVLWQLQVKELRRQQGMMTRMLLKTRTAGMDKAWASWKKSVKDIQDSRKNQHAARVAAVAAYKLDLELMQTAMTVLAVHTKNRNRRKKLQLLSEQMFIRLDLRLRQQRLRVLLCVWGGITRKYRKVLECAQRRWITRWIKCTRRMLLAWAKWVKCSSHVSQARANGLLAKRFILLAWAQRAQQSSRISQAQANKVAQNIMTLCLLLWSQWLQNKLSRRHIEETIVHDWRFNVLSNVFLALKYAASKNAKYRRAPEKQTKGQSLLQFSFPTEISVAAAN